MILKRIHCYFFIRELRKQNLHKDPLIMSSKEIYGTKGNILEGKRILIGVTGSIAAIEVPHLIREILRYSGELVVVLSKEALRFVIDTYCTEETYQIGNQKPVDLLRIISSVGEGNLKLITEMDPKVLRKVFRINAILQQEGEPLQEILRRTVVEYLKINSNPVIYILQDPGLLVTTA